MSEYSYQSLKNRWRLAGISLIEFFGLLAIGFAIAIFWYKHVDKAPPNMLFIMIITAIIGLVLISAAFHYILKVPTISNYYLGLNKYRDVVSYERNNKDSFF